MLVVKRVEGDGGRIVGTGEGLGVDQGFRSLCAIRSAAAAGVRGVWPVSAPLFYAAIRS
jgi:hypothetical protein